MDERSLDEIDARLGDALFGLRSWRDGQLQDHRLDQSLGPQQNTSADESGGGADAPATPTQMNVSANSNAASSNAGLRVNDLVVVEARVPRVVELDVTALADDASVPSPPDPPSSSSAAAVAAAEAPEPPSDTTAKTVAPPAGSSILALPLSADTTAATAATTRAWHQRERFLRRREARARAHKKKTLSSSRRGLRAVSLADASRLSRQNGHRKRSKQQREQKRRTAAAAKRDRPIIAIVDGMLVREPKLTDKRSRAKAAELLKQRHEEENLSARRKFAARARLQRLQKAHAREHAAHLAAQERIARQREARKAEAWEMKQLLLLRRSEKAAARHRGIARRVDRDQSTRHAAAMRRRIELQEQESERLEEMARRFGHDADMAMSSTERFEALATLADPSPAGRRVGASGQSARAASAAFRAASFSSHRNDHISIRRKSKKRTQKNRQISRPMRLHRPRGAADTTTRMRDNTLNASYNSERSVGSNMNNVSVVGGSSGNTSMMMSMGLPPRGELSLASNSKSRWQRTKREAEARRTMSHLKSEEAVQRRALAKKFAKEKMQLRRAKEELEELRRGVEARRVKEDVPEIADSALGTALRPSSATITSSTSPPAPASTASALELEVSETSRRLARQLRKMEKRVETEKRKRESMQSEIKAAKREAKRSTVAASHVSHHAEGAAWVPSTSATPVIGESGTASSERGGERWRRVRAQAEKRRREAEATMAMGQRRKVLIEQLKAEKRRQRKIEKQAKALGIDDRSNSKEKKPALKKKFKPTGKRNTSGSVAPPAPSTKVTAAPKVPPSASAAPSPHALDVMLSQELKGVLKRERDHMRRSFEAAADSKVIADEVESRIRDMVIEKATSAAVAAAVATTKASSATSSVAGQPSRRPRRSKKRTTKAVSPRLGLSRAERVKARELKEGQQRRRQGQVKSSSTQSTPSLLRTVAGKSATVASPTTSEAEAAAYAAASPATSQLSMGSELDRTEDSYVGMGFEEDFQTAGGWEELQELLAFHSPASSVKQHKQVGSSSSRKKTQNPESSSKKTKRTKLVGSSQRQVKSKNEKDHRHKRGTENTGPKSTAVSSRLKVTQVTPGVPVPLKTSTRSGEKKKSEKKKNAGVAVEEKGPVDIVATTAAVEAEEEKTVAGASSRTSSVHDGILGIGVDFDARIEEQRRKWDEERLAFAERLKALQSGTRMNTESQAPKLLKKGDENLPEDDADNEADSSLDASLHDSGSGSVSAVKSEGTEAVDKDASDLLWLNKASLKMVENAATSQEAVSSAPAPTSGLQQQNGDGIAHSGGSSQGSPLLSNDENLDLSRLNLSPRTTPQSKKKKGSRSPFSTPPQSVSSARSAPLSSPPPSLFKTDIVDSVVEQHSIREAASSVSTSLTFDSNSELDSDSGGDEQDQQLSVEL